VILSEEKDDYFLLAREIAKAENATLINSVNELNKCCPKYLRPPLIMQIERSDKK